MGSGVTNPACLASAVDKQSVLESQRVFKDDKSVLHKKRVGIFDKKNFYLLNSELLGYFTFYNKYDFTMILFRIRRGIKKLSLNTCIMHTIAIISLQQLVSYN